MSSLLIRRTPSHPITRHLLKSYATSTESQIKLASTPPTSADQTAAITVVIKAGSRHEPSAGLAHVLKNSLLKGTNKRSAIRLVRETELYGAVLSSALTRESLVLTAEFMKGDEGFFAEALGDAVTQAKFAPHEYNESVLPAVAAEYEQSLRSPTHHALDLAHSLAFRSGLGSSLFADPHTAVDHATTIAFANATFGQASNIAVAATGVEESTLRSLVDEFFTTSTPAAASTSTLSPTQYFGGDLRIASVLHSASPSDTLLLAFQGASSASSANLSVLRHLLGGESSIKWSKGTSPLSLLSTSSHVSAQAFNLAYSDAGLFGVVLRAPTREMRALAEKTIAILNSLKSAGGIKEESLKQAIAKAKFEKASEVESKIARLESVGAQLLLNGSVQSLESAFAELDAVTVESLTKAATAALSTRPSTVAVGDVHGLPYADSLGL